MINLSIYNVKLVKEKGALYELENKKIGSPEDSYNMLKEVFNPGELAEEVLLMISLNTKNRVTGLFEVSRGTLDASLVHPREVFKRAILNNASSIIIAHNHPSGHLNPSREDIELTRKLMDAGRILGISLLDHIIIGDDDYYSLMSNEFLKEEK